MTIFSEEERKGILDKGKKNMQRAKGLRKLEYVVGYRER